MHDIHPKYMHVFYINHEFIKVTTHRFMFSSCFRFISLRLDWTILGKIIMFERDREKTNKISQTRITNNNGNGNWERNDGDDEKEEEDIHTHIAKSKQSKPNTDCWHAVAFGIIIIIRPCTRIGAIQRKSEKVESGIIRSLRGFIAPQLSIKLNASINKHFVRYSTLVSSSFFFSSFSYALLFDFLVSLLSSHRSQFECEWGRFGWCRSFVFLVLSHVLPMLLFSRSVIAHDLFMSMFWSIRAMSIFFLRFPLKNCSLKNRKKFEQQQK